MLELRVVDDSAMMAEALLLPSPINLLVRKRAIESIQVCHVQAITY